MSKKDIDKSFLRDLAGGETKIDLSDTNNLSNKVLSERETRKRLLNHARLVGCENEMQQLFNKADATMRNCTNEQERKDIGKVFTISVYDLLGGNGKLFVDGQLVCDDEKK